MPNTRVIVNAPAPAGRGPDELFLTELPAGSIPAAAVSGLEGLPPTTVFNGVLSQAADGVPTLVTLSNTLGQTATPGRTGAGVFTLTFAGAVLTAAKVLVLVAVNGDADVIVQATVTSTTVLTLETFVAAVADDFNGDLFVKIEVYP